MQWHCRACGGVHVFCAYYSTRTMSSSNASRYKQYQKPNNASKDKKKGTMQPLSQETLLEHQKVAVDLLKRGFERSDNPHGLAETTEFVIKFPVFREPYFKQEEKNIEKHLKERGLALSISYTDGEVTVSTTSTTFDPYAIIKGRDFIKLIARGLATEHSLKIFEDGTHYEIVPIWKYVYAKDVFAKRRKRLLGPNGETLKALEILTGTYIVIMGKTVAIVGPVFGVRRAVDVVVDCMKNIHPLHHIKKLMVLRELENNPKMQSENWSAYLPEFKKKNHKKGKKVIKKKRNLQDELKHVFPESTEKSKLDLQIESGEYFMSDKEKQQYRNAMLEEQHEKAKQNKQRKIKELTTAPKEKARSDKKDKRDTEALISNIKSRHGEANKKRKRKAEEFVEKKRSRSK